MPQKWDNYVFSLLPSASHSIMNARSPSFIHHSHTLQNSSKRIACTIVSISPKESPPYNPTKVRWLEPSSIFVNKFNCIPSSSSSPPKVAYNVWESLAPRASGSLGGGGSLKSVNPASHPILSPTSELQHLLHLLGKRIQTDPIDQSKWSAI